MRRIPLALALSAALLALTQAAPSAASTADTCSFDHRIAYWTSFEPPHPCAGQPLSLVVHDCGSCDHIISGGFGDQGVYLEFVSTQVCPRTLICQPESLVVPLGIFQAGNHALTISSHARVISGTDSLGCDVFQQDLLTWTVDSCAVPIEPALPFVTAVRIGARSPCIECPPTICPGDSIPVSVVGVTPSPCFTFRGLRLVPSDVGGPLPQPPLLVIQIETCPNCISCPPEPAPFASSVMLPPLPLGDYHLSVQELWLAPGDPSRVDSTFQASYPFSVVDACTTSFRCFLTDWEHQAGGCDAFVDSGHPAVTTLDIHTTAALAGLQGTLSLSSPGLAITQLEPVGPAATWKMIWEPFSGGAKYVMFSVDGSQILPSLDGVAPVLRATLTLTATTPPAPVTYLSSVEELASDPTGLQIYPCPVLRIINPAARICFGGHSCDINRDGVADIRDLVLMVNCVLGTGFCPDSGTALIDCNQDGRKTIDDVLCCAAEVLHGRMPDGTPRRPEPSVHVSLGIPERTAAGVDIPVSIAGADRLGAARLAFRFPADRFRYASADIASASWLALGQADGADLTLGLIGLGGAGGPSSVEATLHLALQPGQAPGGELWLSAGDFSGPDGAALEVALAPAVLPMDGVPRLLLAAPQPNPFSGETRFSVTIPPSAASVEVTVHDLAGRRVATLYRGSPPVHFVSARDQTPDTVLPLRWAGTDDAGGRVRDGVYFVHVRAANTDVTRKIILLRGN